MQGDETQNLAGESSGSQETLELELEYDEVHELLRRVAPQYPSLTLDEMHQLFDETYERMALEDEKVSNG